MREVAPLRRPNKWSMIRGWLSTSYVTYGPGRSTLNVWRTYHGTSAASVYLALHAATAPDVSGLILGWNEKRKVLWLIFSIHALVRIMSWNSSCFNAFNVITISGSIGSIIWVNKDLFYFGYDVGICTVVREPLGNSLIPTKVIIYDLTTETQGFQTCTLSGASGEIVYPLSGMGDPEVTEKGVIESWPVT